MMLCQELERFRVDLNECLTKLQQYDAVGNDIQRIKQSFDRLFINDLPPIKKELEHIPEDVSEELFVQAKNAFLESFINWRNNLLNEFGIAFEFLEGLKTDRQHPNYAELRSAIIDILVENTRPLLQSLRQLSTLISSINVRPVEKQHQLVPVNYLKAYADFKNNHPELRNKIDLVELRIRQNITDNNYREGRITGVLQKYHDLVYHATISRSSDYRIIYTVGPDRVITFHSIV